MRLLQLYFQIMNNTYSMLFKTISPKHYPCT